MSNQTELAANNADLENLLQQALAMPTTEEVLNEAKTYTEEYAAPAGFGLGGSPSKNITTLEELDVVRGSGWYTFARIGTTINGVYLNYALVKFDTHSANQAWQELRPMDTQTVLKRAYYNGAWSEWECDNPPMVEGVEYRTTQRWKDRAVYTKLINLGTLSANKDVAITPCSVSPYVFKIIGSVAGRVTPIGHPGDDWSLWITYDDHLIKVRGGAAMYSVGYTGRAQIWYVEEWEE